MNAKYNSAEWGGMVTRLLYDLLDVEVTRGSKGTSLDRRDRERYGEHPNGTSYPQSHAYLVYIVPIRDRQRIGELPVLIHKVKLVSRQKRGQDQLHFQLGHHHSRARVPTGSPTQERIDTGQSWVRSQPSTGVVLVRFGVVFGVQVDIIHGICEEISSSDYLFVNFYLLMNVPSEVNNTEGDSL